jgi:hypothetical protein
LVPEFVFRKNFKNLFGGCFHQKRQIHIKQIVFLLLSQCLCL